MAKRLFLGFWCVWYLCSGVAAQPLQAYIRAADKALTTHNYYGAWKQYAEVLEVTPDNEDVRFKMAKALYYYGAYNDALKQMEGVSENRFDEYSIFMGLTLKRLGRYDEAKKYYRKAMNVPTVSAIWSATVQQEMMGCDSAQAIVARSVRATVQHLGTGINTAFSEFAPYYWKQGLLYSSLDVPNKDTMQAYISKLYFAENEQGVALKEELNRSQALVANAAIAPDGLSVYYTKCAYQPNGDIHCALYVAPIVSGDMGTGRLLPKQINVPNTNTTHPHIANTPEGLMLFFASDRSGGYGQLDLWKVKVNGTDYGTPENLGSVINTQGNEVTPFYDTPSSILYFSSDFHIGLGGYDIFYVSDRSGHPTNVGTPINSSFNDLYFVQIPNDTVGYFASNRTGSLYDELESCCTDLYRFARQMPVVPPPIAITPIPPTPPTLPQPPVHVSVLPPPVVPPLPSQPKEIPPTVQVPVSQPIPDDWFPLKLYFHNDEPDSNTVSPTTRIRYDDAFHAYYALLPLYIEQYTQSLQGQVSVDAADQIRQFFDNEVAGSYYRLAELTRRIEGQLALGKKVTLYVSGHTSPRAPSSYNDRLSQRRIQSLLNYLNQTPLQPYILNKQLVVLQVPKGETLVPTGVNDSYANRRLSIYSVEASRERRIEITTLKIE